MKILKVVVGDYAANCYICICEKTKEALVIDPGENGAAIMDKINEHDAKVRYIVNTHGHSDHIGANNFVKKATGALLLIHEEDGGMLVDARKNLSAYTGKDITSEAADKFIQDGDTVDFGEERFTVLHTPGHTKGGICLHNQGYVFTGDTLFAQSIGRTDFPGGSMKEIIESIKSKLMVLDDQVNVLPGHGMISSIGRERAANPFL